MERFAEAEAAAAPIYDIRDLLEDPQYQALDSITTVQDPDLGPLKMQNVMFRLSDTPGAIRSTGRAKGADNESVYRELLGLDRACLNELATKGVI
jgi:crotonobetainyl-CoA:carnitine CoA-transferase CaiB-like acyl-CoA transferase